MKINSIKLVGFKGYEKETVYNLNNNSTLISGPNGAGKTSIPEGICWCLYGCNLIGNDKFDSLLLNKNSEEMTVELEIFVNGAIHKITRTKKKSVTLKLDDTKVTQKALEEIIPNKELFLSVFNPKYFVSLTPTKARTRLINMLPAIDPMQVLEKYNAWDKMLIVSKYKNDINGGIKDITKRLKEAKENFNVLTGEKNTYIQLRNEVENVLEHVVEVIISDDELKLIDQLEEKIRNEKAKSFVEVSANEIKLKLEIVTNKYRELSQSRYIAEINSSITEMELELASMRGQYNVLVKNLEDAKTLGSQCTCCGQGISEEFKQHQINMIVNEIENLKEAANGYKNSIDLIKNMESEKEAEFQNNKKNEMLKIEGEIEVLKAEFKDLDETNRKGKQEFIQAQEEAMGEFVIQLDGLVSKRQASMTALSELQINRANLEKYNDMILETENKISKLDSLIRELTTEKDVLIKYNTNYVNFVGAVLQGYLKDTMINLYKVSSDTGEMKEDFYITYSNKEYSLLSNSERIRVGLEIASMFNELLSVEYPTLVDDSESIINLPKINTQMIVCKVENIDNINIS